MITDKLLACSSRTFFQWILQHTPRSQDAIFVVKYCLVPNNSPYKYYSDVTGPKGPSKEEKIESMKMPGFVHPESITEEGYFTQKAKQQLEELKKKIDKPTIENSERKE